eukprot:2941837-Amphidinium_carterae.1
MEPISLTVQGGTGDADVNTRARSHTCTRCWFVVVHCGHLGNLYGISKRVNSGSALWLFCLLHPDHRVSPLVQCGRTLETNMPNTFRAAKLTAANQIPLCH